ncbi:hypothetical protein, partial [Enterococcus faecalis]|uniref:hypothetical protein n=1 Tax=Enterococcus faecalis TaxID=1351 RepID=UPI003D6A3E38
DEVLRHRVRREIGARGHVLPRWLVELPASQATGAVVRLPHVPGDGENLLFGVRLPGGAALALATYVDHNLGTLVKDGFVSREPVQQVLDDMAAATDDPDVTVTDLDPADARAMITEAFELGRI